MDPYRIALANVRVPEDREEALSLAEAAIADAAAGGAQLVAFPECFIPGYRALGRTVEPPDSSFLERAWAALSAACAKARVTAVVGTERVVEGKVRASVLVIDASGSRLGFQDKVQIDPSEDGIYEPGSGRHLFCAGPLRFGVVICHEGWRYPETVRWAARRGAHLVLHPHFHPAEPNGYVPHSYGDPANSFHEKAVLCRAAENTCYFATVNVASEGSPTTSAVASPDGTLLCSWPYGVHGLLFADLDLRAATGLLASRWKPVESPTGNEPT